MSLDIKTQRDIANESIFQKNNREVRFEGVDLSKRWIPANDINKVLTEVRERMTFRLKMDSAIRLLDKIILETKDVNLVIKDSRTRLS